MTIEDEEEPRVHPLEDDVEDQENEEQHPNKRRRTAVGTYAPRDTALKLTLS